MVAGAPDVRQPFDVAAFPDLLRRHSQRRATAALSAFARSDETDQVQTVIDAGIPVELLAKAYLATLNPVLLASERADLDTILHLVGRGHLARTPLHAIRTLGAHEACIRCGRLLPDFRYVPQVDSQLFTARNAGAHLALVTRGTPSASVRAMVRLLEPLIVALGIDRAEYFGDTLPAVDALLDETAAEIQAHVETLLLAARQRLARRVEGLDPAVRDSVIISLGTGRASRSSDMEEEQRCPACGEEGILGCTVREYGPPEVDPDDPEGPAWMEQAAFAEWFECSVCELSLNKLEVAATNGIPSEIYLDPRVVDLSDYYADYEPDEEDLADHEPDDTDLAQYDAGHRLEADGTFTL